VCIVSSVTGCTAATRMAYIRLQNTVEVSFNRARGRNSTAGNSLRHSDRGWSALKTGVEFNASHSSTQRRASPRTNGLILQKIMQRAKMRLHIFHLTPLRTFYFNWKINCDSLCSLHISHSSKLIICELQWIAQGVKKIARKCNSGFLAVWQFFSCINGN